MTIIEAPSPPVSTFERWLAERERRNGGIVPPWLLPENEPRIPEPPLPDEWFAEELRKVGE